MFNRSLIVVPVDGSPETEHTVPICREHRQTAWRLMFTLIQVVDRRSGTLWRAPKAKEGSGRRLRALRPAAEQEGVSVESSPSAATPTASFLRMRNSTRRAWSWWDITTDRLACGATAVSRVV